MENSVRELLPYMVQVSNNSKLTQKVTLTLCQKLSKEEFEEFKFWLRNLVTKSNS